MQTTSDYLARRTTSSTGRAQPRKKVHIDRQLIEDYEEDSGTSFSRLRAVTDVDQVTTRLPHVVASVPSAFIHPSDTNVQLGSIRSINILHNRLLQDGRWCFRPYDRSIRGATLDDGSASTTIRVLTETSPCQDIVLRPFLHNGNRVSVSCFIFVFPSGNPVRRVFL